MPCGWYSHGWASWVFVHPWVSCSIIVFIPLPLHSGCAHIHTFFISSLKIMWVCSYPRCIACKKMSVPIEKLWMTPLRWHMAHKVSSITVWVCSHVLHVRFPLWTEVMYGCAYTYNIQPEKLSHSQPFAKNSGIGETLLFICFKKKINEQKHAIFYELMRQFSVNKVMKFRGSGRKIQVWTLTIGDFLCMVYSKG